MEEDNKSIIKLKISRFDKFLCFKMHIILGFYMSLFCFILLFIVGVNENKLIYNLKISLIIDAMFIIMGLLGMWKMKHAKWVSVLTIDKRKKEFRSYIYDIKKEVIFRADDIVEVGNALNMFRFFLKDDTWVSWSKNVASEQILEEIIKSFGISIVNKTLW